jgi:hypothetical protein
MMLMSGDMDRPLNCTLLQDISARMEKWDDSTCIGDIFYRMAALFNIYRDYAVMELENGQIDPRLLPALSGASTASGRLFVGRGPAASLWPA